MRIYMKFVSITILNIKVNSIHYGFQLSATFPLQFILSIWCVHPVNYLSYVVPSVDHFCSVINVKCVIIYERFKNIHRHNYCLPKMLKMHQKNLLQISRDYENTIFVFQIFRLSYKDRIQNLVSGWMIQRIQAKVLFNVIVKIIK